MRFHSAMALLSLKNVKMLWVKQFGRKISCCSAGILFYYKISFQIRPFSKSCKLNLQRGAISTNQLTIKS